MKKTFLTLTVLLLFNLIPACFANAGGPTPVAPVPVPVAAPAAAPAGPAAPAAAPVKTEKKPSEVPAAKEEPSKVAPGQGIPLSGIGLPANLPKFGLNNETDPQKFTESFMLRYVINPIFIISGALAILMIIYSAGRIITGRGEEDALTAAKTTLTWATIGLALIMLAFTLVNNIIRIIQSQI